MSIQRIPKLFFQTSKGPLEPYIVKMTKAMIPSDWIYRHFLDSDIVHFLKSHPLKEFPGALEVFQKLKRGEHKADFFRYYFLFVGPFPQCSAGRSPLALRGRPLQSVALPTQCPAP
ncbi:MAG: hypothetical protein EBU66_16345 [Bacteroidetes bacterium]|nr:hypothetical protein [Bacteroidota bacterium]